MSSSVTTAVQDMPCGPGPAIRSAVATSSRDNGDRSFTTSCRSGATASAKRSGFLQAIPFGASLCKGHDGQSDDKHGGRGSQRHLRDQVFGNDHSKDSGKNNEKILGQQEGGSEDGHAPASAEGPSLPACCPIPTTHGCAPCWRTQWRFPLPQKKRRKERSRRRLQGAARSRI